MFEHKKNVIKHRSPERFVDAIARPLNVTVSVDWRSVDPNSLSPTGPAVGLLRNDYSVLPGVAQCIHHPSFHPRPRNELVWTEGSSWHCEFSQTQNVWSAFHALLLLLLPSFQTFKMQYTVLIHSSRLNTFAMSLSLSHTQRLLFGFHEKKAKRDTCAGSEVAAREKRAEKGREEKRRGRNRDESGTRPKAEGCGVAFFFFSQLPV